jgi:hypothetical protein
MSTIYQLNGKRVPKKDIEESSGFTSGVVGEYNFHRWAFITCLTKNDFFFRILNNKVEFGDKTSKVSLYFLQH